MTQPKRTRSITLPIAPPMTRPRAEAGQRSRVRLQPDAEAGRNREREADDQPHAGTLALKQPEADALVLDRDKIEERGHLDAPERIPERIAHGPFADLVRSYDGRRNWEAQAEHDRRSRPRLRAAC